MYCRVPLANPPYELQRHKDDDERGRKDVNEGQQAVRRETGVQIRGAGKTRSVRRDEQDISSGRRRRQADEHQEHDDLRESPGQERC